MVNESMSVCVLSIEPYEGAEIEEDAQFSDRKSTRLNSSHSGEARMPSSA